MNTYISMLRGINVSGQNMIKMGDLKSLYESLGFLNVRTYLQSGNVVFDSPASDYLELSNTIAAQIKQTLGFTIPVFIRSGDDFGWVLANNPFINDRHEDLTRMYVTFLFQKVDVDKIKNLAAPANVTDEFIFGENEIYLFCPDGYGRTKLNNNFFEKKLNTPATTRNWNTVNALYQMTRENNG